MLNNYLEIIENNFSKKFLIQRIDNINNNTHEMNNYQNEWY